MNIKLYKNKSDKMALDKTLQGELSFDGDLRDDCSLTNPIFTIQSDGDLSKYNYAYIAEFGRYYYITEITAQTKSMWMFTCHVDVLMTYKSQVRALTALVHRSESKYNSYITDDMLPLEQYKVTDIIASNLSFKDEEKDCTFVLVATGGYYTAPRTQSLEDDESEQETD